MVLRTRYRAKNRPRSRFDRTCISIRPSLADGTPFIYLDLNGLYLKVKKKKTKKTKDGDDSDSDDDESSDDSDDEMNLERRIPKSHEVQLNHGSKAISAMAIDPSGSRLVTGSIDYEVKFWDFAGMDASLKSFRLVVNGLTNLT